MKSGKYIAIEFFVLFILLPLSLTLSYPLWIKIGLIFTSFIYVIFILLKIEKISLKNKEKPDWKGFLKRILKLFLIIVLITTAYVFLVAPENLFCVVINKPKLWLFILMIYTFLSVYPQELVFRTFFFKRYEKLIQNKNLFLFINAIIFSLGHLFFKNVLVIVLTFLGGLLFAYTFYKTRSTLMTSLEHALYGNWLFTIGMGEMLAFPGMESC